MMGYKLVEQLGVEPNPFASEAAVLETACASRTPLLIQFACAAVTL